MKDVPVFSKILKVNLKYYERHSLLVGEGGSYVRILAQFFSALKPAQRTMSDTAKNIFTSQRKI